MSATSSSHLQKINEFYPWTTEASLAFQHVLCLDSSSLIASNHSGEFLFTSLLLKLLQQINVSKQPETLPRVILVLTNHVRSHYEVILRKNYLDLRSLERAGHVTMINLFANDEECNEWLETQDEQQDVSLGLTWLQLQDWKTKHALQFDVLSSYRRTSTTSTTATTAAAASSTSPTPSTSTTKRSSIFMFDDLEMLEVLSASIQDCKLWFSSLSKQLEMNAYHANIDHQHEQITELMGIISFGRHPEQVKAQLSSMKDSAVISFDDHNHHSVHQALHVDGQPRLTEYLRYR